MFPTEVDSVCGSSRRRLHAKFDGVLHPLSLIYTFGPTFTAQRESRDGFSPLSNTRVFTYNINNQNSMKEVLIIFIYSSA